MPLQLTITQAGANKPAATLDLPAKRITRTPVSVTFRGDTLVFYAATVDLRYACVRSANGQQLRGIWVQPGLRVPLVLSRQEEGSASVVASGAAAPVATTYHTEQVTLSSQPGNVQLAGTLSIPDGPGPFPAAVLLSDFGDHDRDARQGNYRFFAAMATAMARQGIAVLRLDDRGVGQSSGDGSQVRDLDRVHDAQAGLSYLRLRPTIDPAVTGLIGHGEGGNIALLAAAQPVQPGFVVTLAAAGVEGLEVLANQAEPITSPADTTQAGAVRRQAWADVLSKAAQLRSSGSNAAQVETYVSQQRLKMKSEDRKQAEATRKFRRSMFEIVHQTINNDQAQAIVVNMLRQRYPNQDPALTRRRAMDLTTPKYRSFLAFDPQPSLTDVKCPVLLLHGTDDAEVNAASNLTSLEKGLKANKRVTSRRLVGVNHWFQTPAAELIPNPDGTVDSVISMPMLDTVRDWVQLQAGR
ncbi:alpha/beta hydrolase [Hymenobacter sp. B1770]|uniref:alpha/beta hydrolase n=1 Tax=Hymenobacter sp. B1770 TaxID=1718788 RepID=UPI003CED7409